jgi:acetoin utilization deacetylase AcuC-like enzyme
MLREMRGGPEQLLYVDDRRFDEHLAPGAHPECPERLSAIRSGLVEPLRHAGAERIAVRHASSAELQRVHSLEHIASLEQGLARGEGYLDADTFFSPGTREATWLAAGAAAELGAMLARKHNVAGVLALRPPGHHATRTRAMGFCLVNNVAVAAAAALESGLSRVAVVDWDVHHGNGTQAIFEADPRVLMVSLHQWPLYPGTGRSEEIGIAEGRGYTVNLPLPSGSAGRDYRAAMAQVVLPMLRQYRPELVLVSAGFDAHRDDPLGGMALTDQDFGALTTLLWRESGAFGCQRLGLVLEGGYELGALERSGAAVADALLGGALELDPSLPGVRAQQAIDATRRALSPQWEL